MKEEKKVTVYDLADALGVSVGTIYRALHNKGRISPATKKKVLEMAEKMNFKINRAAQSLKRDPIIIGGILCCPVVSYIEEVKRGMTAAFDKLSDLNVTADIRTIIWDEQSYDEHAEVIAAILDEFMQKKYQGLILHLPHVKSLLCKKINLAAQSGMTIATVGNDLHNIERKIYISADGKCAGRLAAEMLSYCCEGKRIALLTGSRFTSIHAANIEGFFSYTCPIPFEAVDVMENYDNAEIFKEQMNQIIYSGRYSGVYITSAISITLPQFIKDWNQIRLRIITTDLFEGNKRLLQERAICATIFQDPFRQGNCVVKKLYRYINENIGEGRKLIVPQIIFFSNRNLYEESELSPNEDIHS